MVESSTTQVPKQPVPKRKRPNLQQEQTKQEGKPRFEQIEWAFVSNRRNQDPISKLSRLPKITKQGQEPALNLISFRIRSLILENSEMHHRKLNR